MARQRTERRYEGSMTSAGADGRHATLRLYVTYIIHEPLDGPRGEMPGSYSLELDDGRTVERLDETTFRVDDTKEILRLVK